MHASRRVIPEPFACRNGAIKGGFAWQNHKPDYICRSRRDNKKCRIYYGCLEPVFTLSSNYFSLRCRWKLRPEMVEKWQLVLEGLKEDRTFEKIYRSYLPDADMIKLLGK